MNRLDTKKRAQILSALCEGNSLRACTRMFGVSINTVTKLLVEVGEACNWYQDENLVDLKCRILQLDEIWSFVGCKEKAKSTSKGEHPGDVWTWTAIDAETKLVPAWFVGDRSAGSAFDFCYDLKKRFSGEVQITSDGLQSYKFAVASAFNDGTNHFAQLVKIYGKDDKGIEVVTGIVKEPRFGNPNMDLVSTSYVERQNLTMRMSMRRFTRLTNGHSKKIENHIAAISLHFMHYNFCRKHQTLKTSPAVAAGVTNKVWTVDNVLDMFDAYWTERHPVDRPARYKSKRKMPKTFEPQAPKTPWYLNPEGEGRENSK